jgi:hypothetical protein
VTARLTEMDLLRVYHLLPILLNILAIPAFCYLAAHFTRDRAAFICAALLYPLMPESYIWQISGGGLPRSMAAALSLMAVGVALRAARRPRRSAMTACGVLVGLAILSHLEWGLCAALGVALALLTGGHSRRFGFVVGAAAISAVIISPWLVAIGLRHGPGPFLASATGSQWDMLMFLRRFFSVQIFAGALVWPAVIGGLRRVQAGDPFAPLWATVILLTTPRMGLAAGLAIPTALLAGEGLKAVADWVRARIGPHDTAMTAGADQSDALLKNPPLVVLLALAAGLLFTPLPGLFIDEGVAAQLDPPTRSAMDRVRRDSPPDATFVVISDAGVWWGDRVAEWFPLLASRESLTTAQGLEWVAPGVFTAKLRDIQALKAVQFNAPKVLPQFVAASYCRADYVALFLPANDVLYDEFAHSSSFRLIFREPRAAVLETRRLGCT